MTSFIRFSIASLVMYYSAFFNEFSLQRSYNELQKTTQREQAAAKQHTVEVMGLLENKKQLMVDISHELRTPLAAMRVNMEALEDGLLAKEEVLPLLQRKLSELNKLIEDVYELSRDSAGGLAFKLHPFRFLPLLEEAITDHQQPARDKGLDISLDAALDDSVTIAGDEGRLRQLLANLLENSLRYTDAGGRVEVRARVLDDTLELLVEDSSPGVGDEHLPVLFERFFRVDKSRSREYGGSGLGLAICRLIVKNHGGTIAAGHSPLGGVQIRVTLPVLKKEN